MRHSQFSSFVALSCLLSIGTATAFAADAQKQPAKSKAAAATAAIAKTGAPAAKPVIGKSALAAARATRKGTAPKTVALKAPSNVLSGTKAAKPGASNDGANEAAEPIQDTQAVLKEMESVLLQSVQDIGNKYKSLVSAPEQYMAKLPSQDEVLQNKDQVNFKNYGGLSEVFLFHDQLKKAQELYDYTARNSATVLGADDPLPGLVSGDFALYYYAKGDYAKAEPLFRQAATTMEKAYVTQPKLKDHLISAYLGLAEVYDKQGKKTEAAHFLGKMIRLSKVD